MAKKIKQKHPGGRVPLFGERLGEGFGLRLPIKTEEQFEELIDAGYGKTFAEVGRKIILENIERILRRCAKRKV